MDLLNKFGNIFAKGAETALNLRIQREEAEIARETREGSLENANPATKDKYPHGVTSTGLPINFLSPTSLAITGAFFMLMIILVVVLMSRGK